MSEQHQRDMDMRRLDLLGMADKHDLSTKVVQLEEQVKALKYRLEASFLNNQELKDERDDLHRLAFRFAKAKGRYHSQQAMCDLLEYFGKPCTRPDNAGDA